MKMTSPTSENTMKESDMFDSDETLVTESQENKHKKKRFRRNGDDTQNTPSEASQSMLRAKKKKYSEISGSDNNETLVKKMRTVTGDFLTQKLFKQSSSENILNLSPTINKKKKKRKGSKINFSGDSDNTISLEQKIKKEFSSPINQTPLEHSTKQVNRVNGFNLSNLSEDDNNIDFGTQNIVKLPSSEEFVNHTPKKLKKKKNRIQIEDSDGRHSVTSPVELSTQPSFEDILNLSPTKSTKEKRKLSKNNISHETGTNTVSLEKKIKQEKGFGSPINRTPLEHSTKQVKKKKKLNENRGFNLSNLSGYDNTIDFGAQNIVKLPSSEEFVNDAPKKLKKKKKRLGLGDSDDRDSVTSQELEVKQEDDFNLSTDNVGDVLKKKDKKKKGKEHNSPSLNQSNTSEIDTIDFCTEDVFKLPDSEEFVNSTPKKLKKKKIKELEINVSDVRDTSPIIEIGHENHLNVTIDELKQNNGHNYSETSRDSNNLKHSNSFDDRALHTSDSSETSKLHHSFDISSDNSKVFSELDDSEIDIPCRKLKKKKKHKEAVGNNISGENGVHCNSNDFFCQFCISSVNNIRKNDSKADNQDILSNRNDFEKCDAKFKKKKAKTPASESGKNNCVWDLLDKYLDNGEALLNDDDDSPTTESDKIHDSPCASYSVTDTANGINNPETIDGNINTQKKKNRKQKILNESFLDVQNKILDKELRNRSYSDIFNNDDSDQDIAGVNSVTNSSEKSKKADQANDENIKTVKKKGRKNKTFSSGQDNIKEKSLSTHLSSEFDNNDENYTRDVVGVNGHGSKSDEDRTVSLNKITKKKTKVKKKNSADAQNLSDDETNLSRNNSKLAERSSESSSISLDLGDDLEPSGSKSKIPEKPDDLNDMSDDDSKNSSGRSNGNDAHFAQSDDSDDVHDKSIKRNLKNLTIDIDFPVPELHKIFNRASKPTPQQRRVCDKKNIPIKVGKFVKAEDTKIMENWQRFIQTYDFEDRPDAFYSLGRGHIAVEEKQNFLYYLSQGLDERPPFSVYRRFKLLTMEVKRGRFTEEEDQYILRQVEESQRRRNYIADIAQHLHRPFHSVEIRIKRLKDRHTRKIRWRKSNLIAFIKYLLKVTSTDPDNLEKLKDKHISSTQWTRLSKKLDGVPIRILKRAWLQNIHPMLFIPDECCDLRDVKLKLIKMLYENSEHDWRAVDWSDYASHFEGLTGSKLYSMMKCLVVHKVASEKRNNLKKCVKILRKLEKEDLGQKVFMYKIKYEDGKIIQVGDNLKKDKRKK